MSRLIFCSSAVSFLFSSLLFSAENKKSAPLGHCEEQAKQFLLSLGPPSSKNKRQRRRVCAPPSSWQELSKRIISRKKKEERRKRKRNR